MVSCSVYYMNVYLIIDYSFLSYCVIVVAFTTLDTTLIHFFYEESLQPPSILQLFDI